MVPKPVLSLVNLHVPVLVTDAASAPLEDELLRTQLLAVQLRMKADTAVRSIPIALYNMVHDPPLAVQ